MKRYIWSVAVWFSQGINVVLLAGHPDMTVSARAHLRAPSSKRWALARRAINWVFFWEEDHCAASFANDVEFALEVLEAAAPRAKR